MKRFILLKLSVLLLGIGGALVLTPSCKAQSEISPDHFDGTDSWAMSARQVHVQSQEQLVAKPNAPGKEPERDEGVHVSACCGS